MLYKLCSEVHIITYANNSTQLNKVKKVKTVKNDYLHYRHVSIISCLKIVICKIYDNKEFQIS